MISSFLSRTFATAGLALGLAFSLSVPSQAVEERDAQKLVDSTYYAYLDLTEGENGATIRSLMKDARAVMIFPGVGKGGLILAAEGGSGLLFARGTDGSWSYPAFYRMRSVSFGLQAGGQKTKIILVIMNDSALTSILEGKIKLGADASIAVISDGVDGELSTNTARQDIYYYAQTDGGLFAGISIEGSDISTRKKHNRAYYDASHSPADIVIRGRARNPGADRLRGKLP